MHYVIIAVAVIFVAVRVLLRRRGRAAKPTAPTTRTPRWTVRGDIPLVAAREIKERTRGRIFRVGTAIILLAVAAAVVIPTLPSGGGSGSSTEKIALAGSSDPTLPAGLQTIGHDLGITITIVDEPSQASAIAALNTGDADLALVNQDHIYVKTAISDGDSSDLATLAQTLASVLGRYRSLVAAGLSPGKAQQLTSTPALPITGLHAAKKTKTHTTTVYGLILLFVLLSQYGTWILMGVVEEKSSRVVEVLLATLKPVQLLAGKVLGIGLVALAQATLIVGVALGLGSAVGSDIVHSGGPTEVLTSVVWLILGYVFYCWVYAAAGSLATRQEHIQTLAFPLQLPLILGYITSLTAVTSNSASTLVHVLAYLPPTAPFAMPALVAIGAVSWWQFTISVMLTLASTVAVARFAASIYERAILRTGQRVKLRDLREAATPRAS